MANKVTNGKNSLPKKEIIIRTIQLTACLYLLTMLTGCSSAPSTGDGKRVIESRIEKESEGRIKLLNFQKKNGMQGELMGVKTYALEFEAEIVITENCKWITGMVGLGQSISFHTSKAAASAQSNLGRFMDDTVNPGMLVVSGQKMKLSGTIQFMKKESGWEAANVQVAQITKLAQSDIHPSSDKADEKLKQRVYGDLCQIDGSKIQWALENRKPASATPNENDLKPFLKDHKFPVHPKGGMYVIRSVKEFPSSTTYGELGGANLPKQDSIGGIDTGKIRADVLETVVRLFGD